MATKAELAMTIEAYLEKGGSELVVNPDEYKKGQLEQLVGKIAEGAEVEEIEKLLGSEEVESERKTNPGRKGITIDDPELLAKIKSDQPVSRADYIRRRFEDGAHRSEITKELDVAYQIIFAATKDMTNAHHSPGKRGGRSKSIEVYNDEGELETISRTEYIRREFRKGRDRSDIAKELEISYGLVYAASKDVERDPEAVAAYKRENASEEDVVDVEDLEEEQEEQEDSVIPD